MSAEVQPLTEIDRIMSKESTYLLHYPTDPFYKKIPKDLRTQLKIDFHFLANASLKKLSEHEIQSLSDRLFSDIWQRYIQIFNKLFTDQRKDPTLYFDLLCSSENSYVPRFRQSLNLTEEEVVNWRDNLNPSTIKLIEEIAGKHFNRESLNISFPSMNAIYCTQLSKNFNADEIQKLYTMIKSEKFSFAYHYYHGEIDKATEKLKVKVLIACNGEVDLTNSSLNSELKKRFDIIPELPEPTDEVMQRHRDMGTIKIFDLFEVMQIKTDPDKDLLEALKDSY